MAKGTDDTIAVRISKVLADRIISGAIEPGARLRQDHIAEEFQTSLVP
ncbi:GntR family transcriptional regulator, partial [Mesorhizobium sp. M7A.F.Ca.CA.004.12.1.1]